MSRQITLKKTLDNVLASVDQSGLWIIGIWTVGIDIEHARKYKDNYNSKDSVNGGFFENDGKVILTHRDSKITLTIEEAKAIRDLIILAEKEYW